MRNIINKETLFKVRKTIIFGLIYLIAPSILVAQHQNVKKEILVSNINELKKAISTAKPGQTIVMKDGNWKDAVIDFNSKASSKLPITLKAQTPGEVILTGKSELTFSKSNLIVVGLFFKNGAIEKGSVINFNSDSCQLTNSAILDYNPSKFKTKYYWVYFKGNHNRVDHCLFAGKSNMHPVIGNDNLDSRHNKVDHCYIKDIPFVKNANGREIIRIWGYGHDDEMGEDGAYFIVEYNLFENADGEGTEIVSLKSNFNIVRYNTIIASRGGLVGRRGKNNTFEGNFIIGKKVKGTTGIRVAGPNHRVFNNYICDVEEDGIRLISGEYFKGKLTSNFKPKKKQLPKYLQVQNGYFAHNTIVYCNGNGIDIGYNYKNDWPNLQMVLIPENNLFVNNLVYNCKNSTIEMVVPDLNAPLDFLTSKPNKFEGNLVFGGRVNLDPIPSGIIYKNPNLSYGNDGLWRPEKNSETINVGVKSDVITDMDGQIRDEKKDVGADEFSESIKTTHPLTADEVGPEWVINKRKSGAKL